QVVFVSTEDEFLPDPTMPPSLVQLSSAGQFSSDGVRLKDLAFLFVQHESEKKRKTPVYVIIDLTNEKETPLPTLMSCLDRIRKAVPPTTRAVIFVRCTSLAKLRAE